MRNQQVKVQRLLLEMQTGDLLQLRNDNDFNLRYPAVVQALGALPDETVIGGEVVALAETGRVRRRGPWRPERNVGTTLRETGIAAAACSY